MDHVRTVTISYDEYQELKEGKYTSLIKELEEEKYRFDVFIRNYNYIRDELASYRLKAVESRKEIARLRKENANLKSFNDSWLGRLFTKSKNK